MFLSVSSSICKRKVLPNKSLNKNTHTHTHKNQTANIPVKKYTFSSGHGLVRIAWLLFQWSFCDLGNIFKSFNHSGAQHYKYFIKFNAINRFNIGVNGPPEKNGWMKSATQYCHRASLCYWAGPSHSFQNISQQAERWRGSGGVGKGQRKSERDGGLSYSGPAPASLLHLGTHLSGGLPLYFTVTGDILVSRCHGEMAPLPRRSPRRRNQWNNKVPKSWG